MKFSLLRKLLRIEQWYKNLIVLMPLLFTTQARTGFEMFLAVLGFCLVSSTTYMINDWTDRKEDALHPTKKQRPFASGKVSGKHGLIIGSILLTATIAISLALDPLYAFSAGTYFIATNLYSFGLKNIPLLDITMIAFNFLLRMSGGMQSIKLETEWQYFTLVFAIILMFLSHKRRSDIKILGKKTANKHKPVLRFYRRAVVYTLRGISYGLIIWALFTINLPLLNLAATITLLFTTSTLFVQDPKLVIKPHYLLKKPLWLGSLAVFVLAMILI